ncbi:hypothetical protein Vi05172_g4189 [Venturia inaequalis]|nr:hypothetical protein Vi05172_g4189 [Venturia inaequalis]
MPSFIEIGSDSAAREPPDINSVGPRNQDTYPYATRPLRKSTTAGGSGEVD